MTCPLCRGVCADSVVREALGREQSGLLQRQPPARGDNHTSTPLPSPPLPGQQQRQRQQQRSSEPLSHQPQPGCAAGSQRPAPALLRSPAHPRLTHLAAEAQLIPPRGRGTAAHGRRMAKAAGEHLGAGRGDACESARCCHPRCVGVKHPPASL